MSLLRSALPSDPEALRVFAQQLQAFADGLQAELYAKTLHIEKLKSQLAALRRARFGRSSEKLDRTIEQLELQIEALEQGDDDREETRAESRGAEDAAKEVPEKKDEPADSRPAPARRAIPAHLPRETVTHAAPCACPTCGGTAFRPLGEDRREVLEYVPSHFKAVVHVRPKLSCRACETIVQPPMPDLPIERGLPGPGLLAHVLVAKYCDHLPLYRQSEIYAREGVELERSTLADWVGRMAFLLQPLAERIARHVRAGEAVHADDTPVPVLDPGRGSTKTGRLWVAVRDERPWGSAVPPAVFYRYAPDRKAEQARALLEGVKGHLHADGYSGFAALYESRTGPPHPPPPLTEVACWAHARRKIYEVHAATGSATAKTLLDDIAKLFAIEAAIMGRPPEQRLAARVIQAAPLLAELKASFDSTLARISGKTALAGALRYAITRWDALTRYTTDGRLEISNNAAERAIRPLALGRKNWLFAGSDQGGCRAATLYTIIETAKLNGLDPEAYLRSVVARIAAHPINRLDDLLPWNITL